MTNSLIFNFTYSFVTSLNYAVQLKFEYLNNKFEFYFKLFSQINVFLISVPRKKNDSKAILFLGNIFPCKINLNSQQNEKKMIIEMIKIWNLANKISVDIKLYKLAIKRLKAAI